MVAKTGDLTSLDPIVNIEPFFLAIGPRENDDIKPTLTPLGGVG